MAGALRVFRVTVACCLALTVVSSVAEAFKVYTCPDGREVSPDQVTTVISLASTTIRYWIDQNTIPSNLSLEDVRGAVQEAAKQWESVTGLQASVRFEEVKNADLDQPGACRAWSDAERCFAPECGQDKPLFDCDDGVTIISWDRGHISHLADTFVNRGCPSGTLRAGADIFLNSVVSCNGLFEIEPTWEVSHWRAALLNHVYLPAVLAHEFGHVLGLGHSDVKGALMQTGDICKLTVAGQFSAWRRWLSLVSDDQLGLRYLYGPNRLPTIRRLLVNGAPVEAGTTVNVNPGEQLNMVVDAIDEENNPLEYYWRKFGGSFKGGCRKADSACVWQAPSSLNLRTLETLVIGVRDVPPIRDRAHRKYVVRYLGAVVQGAENSIEVSLNASRTSLAPRSSVTLRAATLPQSRQSATYWFYCDRVDAGTDIVSPYQLRLESRDASVDASGICGYTAPGNHTAKVVVERGKAPRAEARIVIAVTGCGDAAIQAGEQCDGVADAACPGRCLTDCSCGPGESPTPTSTPTQTDTPTLTPTPLGETCVCQASYDSVQNWGFVGSYLSQTFKPITAALAGFHFLVSRTYANDCPNVLTPLEVSLYHLDLSERDPTFAEYLNPVARRILSQSECLSIPQGFSPVDVALYFESPVAVVPGDVYTAVLSAESLNFDAWLSGYSSTDVYSGGSFSYLPYRDQQTNHYATKDLSFMAGGQEACACPTPLPTVALASHTTCADGSFQDYWYGGNENATASSENGVGQTFVAEFGGVVHSIAAYGSQVDSMTYPTHVRAQLFAFSGNVNSPKGSLIATSDEIDFATGYIGRVFDFPSRPFLSAGSSYYLFFLRTEIPPPHAGANNNIVKTSYCAGGSDYLGGVAIREKWDGTNSSPTGNYLPGIDLFFSVNGTSITGTNLIVNGDFELGNTGFSTDFAFDPVSGYIIDHAYTVVTDARTAHRDAASYSDHTLGNGTGLMMVVNGSAMSDSVVWSETVAVEPGRMYAFQLWLSSWYVSPPTYPPAGLRVRINGVAIGPDFTAPLTTGAWNLFSASWFSDSSTSAIIEIVNTTTDLFGNDFALDDISFAP